MTDSKNGQSSPPTLLREIRGSLSTIAPALAGLLGIGLFLFPSLVLEVFRMEIIDGKLAVSFSTILSALSLILAVALLAFCRSRYLPRPTSQVPKLMKPATAPEQPGPDIVADVSHEIRIPLNGIIGFAETILQCESLPVIHKQANTILQESEALLELINTLLDDAKIKAGRLEMAPQTFDLHEILEQIGDIVEHQTSMKGVDFRLNVEEALPRTVIGDPVWIRRVLLNLSDNAVRFTRSGRVTIQVESIGRNEENSLFRFSVIDTGIGIPKKDLDSIFQPYDQGSNLVSRKYGGTGLGTTISQRLVRSMGGDIGIESETDQGTLFWFTVPLIVAEAPRTIEHEGPLLSPSPQSDISDKEPPKHHTGRILLVEDYAPNRELARIHLESDGHDVTTTETGVQALEATKRQPFDLILMDIQMPEMNGYEAARRIRTEGAQTTNTPILALTANADAGSAAECRKAGMNDVITKPIRRESFLAKVQLWLQKSPGEGPESRDTAEGSTSPEDPAMDYDLAVSEFAGDRDLVDSVLDRFLLQVEEQIPRILKGLEHEDTELMRAESHKLRGGAAGLAAMPLAEAARILEETAGSRDLAGSEEAVRELETQFARLRSFARERTGV